MNPSVKVRRLFAGPDGLSRFETMVHEQGLKAFAPPAPAFHVSDMRPALRYATLHLPVGWTDDGHPSPARQVLFALRGAIRVTPGVGAAEVIAAGEAWLMEDTSGGGHGTAVVSAEPFDAVVIQLPP